MIAFKVTHANLKKEMFVAAPLFASTYVSEADKCTHIIFAGGAMVPVEETPEEVIAKVEAYYEWKAENEHKVFTTVARKTPKTKGTEQ